jgi:hypothetical protein
MSVRRLAATLVLLALPSAASAAVADKSRPVDVALCLDVSGSMNGLIDSARVKLWDIVIDLARAKPTPDLRVALYSYGHTSYDPKAGWVRKEVDLTRDLDEVYKRLNALTIDGGDEYVARVCRDALAQQAWSSDKDALKVIFVCGNEPATQDPLVKLPEVAKLAHARGVIINAIYCGGDAADWRDFAVSCEGRYFSIDQGRGTVSIAAPQDKRLSELSEKLNRTYCAYGKEGAEKALEQKAQDANATKFGAPVAAQRATAKGGGLYRNEDWDLVDRCKKDPKFDLKALKPEELPEEMRKLKPEERAAYVKKLAEERAAVQKEIAELSEARRKHVDAELKKQAAGPQGLDTALRGAIREQAAKKGVVIPE